MKIKTGSEEIEVPIKKLSKLGMMKGLMFCRRERAKAFLFDFKNIKIHSWFVFFPFLAVWLNEENRVVEKKLVKPFKFLVSSAKPSFKLLEIPVNFKHEKIIKFLVGG